MRLSRFVIGAAGMTASLWAFALTPGVVGSARNGASGQSLCIAHHPTEYVWYTASCTGHDEPEIDPLSNHPGSAQDLTWAIVLPTDGVPQGDAVGPTFGIGGTGTAPNSRYGKAVLE